MTEEALGILKSIQSEISRMSQSFHAQSTATLGETLLKVLHRLDDIETALEQMDRRWSAIDHRLQIVEKGCKKCEHEGDVG